MTNTTLNVPRELLERVLDYDGAVAIRQNARHELRALLSDPSPAGVDECKCSMSISMLGDGCRHCQPQEYIDRLGEMLDEERAELSDAQAIIDGLAVENHQLRRELNLRQSQIESSGRIAERAQRFAVQLRTERDQHAKRIGELEGLLTAERNKVPLYEAVERACGDLPEGWKVELHMENGAGWIELYDPEGIEVENFPTNNERLDYTINDATDAALSAGKEGE